jgi:hypothetical protein
MASLIRMASIVPFIAAFLLLVFFKGEQAALPTSLAEIAPAASSSEHLAEFDRLTGTRRLVSYSVVH